MGNNEIKHYEIQREAPKPRKPKCVQVAAILLLSQSPLNAYHRLNVSST